MGACLGSLRIGSIHLADIRKFRPRLPINRKTGRLGTFKESLHMLPGIAKAWRWSPVWQKFYRVERIFPHRWRSGQFGKGIPCSPNCGSSGFTTLLTHDLSPIQWQRRGKIHRTRTISEEKGNRARLFTDTPTLARGFIGLGRSGILAKKP